ncbi:hypothetical protein TVAG_148410 [Trichomonas vaginalis G3]|uniref:VPS9 domain-containing protein n=1 Tax=Trichomonas vaginalis (strain ATCC PRA-98 / G3) TaxID=412133 RepID=A2G5U9_TRIV3|nr:VPS9 domain family [Trichomonas vaginalis G3]EAX87474.1 hypothetical protein TVAG_148410 [Trichomonas vaginalis G3]KAI5539101.1 VPS9 domain family [Trichomonas vaginalis G3]|eukprot:XP_001300404.1 hypothetical protein [Trichomonas vaginalis G3]
MSESSKPRICFDDWVEAHHKLLENIEFLTQNDNNSQQSNQKFQMKRQGIHTREYNRLTNVIESLESLVHKTEQELDHQYLDDPCKNVFPYYGVRSDNFLVRELIYLEKKRTKLRLKGMTFKLVQYNNKLLELYEVASLFTLNIIPLNTICRPLQKIFAFEDFPQKESTINKDSRLTARINYIRSTLAKIKTPAWVSDFQSYLITVARESVLRTDSKTSYFYPTEQEIEISRALLSRPTKFSTEIETIFKELKVNSPKEPFIQSLVQIAYEWMPKDLKTPEEMSACILILFRVGFNYVYQKYSNFFICSEEDNKISEKIEKIARRPLSDFPFPLGLMQKSDSSSCIRDVFRNDAHFYSASQFLALAEYESNPLDALFAVHKCLVCIHKAALINRLGVNPASLEDVNSLLCFDDLFSLFFGTAIASDISSLGRLYSFIDEYIPKQCLSPSFEYSYSNLQALILHIKNI